MIIDAIDEIIRTYAISRPIEAFFSFIALIPSSLLLIFVQKSTLHPNCRALISLWTTAQIVLSVNILIYSSYFVFVEYEVYPVDQFDPPIRMVFTENAIRFYSIVMWFELGISLERGFSIKSPQLYHVKQRSTKALGVFVITAVLCGHLFAGLITYGAFTPQAIIGTILTDAVETTAFLANALVFFHSKRRMENKSIQQTLNGRYQMQETYNVSRMMLPVYLFSFTFKIPLLILNWLFIFDYVPYYITDIFGIPLFAMSCACMSSTFLFRHDAIRNRLKTHFCRSRENNIVEVSKAPSSDHVTSEYFKQLEAMWQ